MWWLSNAEYQGSEETRFAYLKRNLSEENGYKHPVSLLYMAYSFVPHQIALIDKDGQCTYQEFGSRVQACATLFKSCGLSPSDRVMICLENSIEFYVAYYAVWQCEAVVVPINTFLKKQEIDHILSDADPRIVIINTERQDDFIASKAVVLFDKDIKNAEQGTLHILDTSCAVMCPPDTLAALLYTSGTTGTPKGVMLTARNIMTNVAQALARMNFTDHERVLAILPLFHAFAQNACMWTALAAASTIIIVSKIDRKNLLWGLSLQPTVFLGVPALYGLLCLLKTAPLTSVSFFISGGDALPDKIRMYFSLLYQRKICTGYGLTETSPLITIDFDDESMPTANTGRPVCGIECEIRDEDGTVLERGKIGRLWVRGDNIMKGYYNAPEETEKAIVKGWFDTGDLAYITSEGKIVITGRLKDLIINKGLNIYPQEIENIIMSHPNVMRVGVIGKRDDSEGEIPIAFVQVREKNPEIQQDLKKLCMQHLASYKVPREFRCSLEDLPLTATAKVDKKVLRRILEDV